MQTVDYKLELFSNSQCELGEGPIWHPSRHSLIWLDILERKLYEKHPSSCEPVADTVWELPEFASALSVDADNPDIIWMVTNKTFGRFSLKDGKYQAVLELYLGDRFRANDGSVSPSGDFWFGSMEWKPESRNGGLYSISPGLKLTRHEIPLGIPNTFCWSAKYPEALISDSMQQTIYRFQLADGCHIDKNATVFTTLKGTNSIPDGGALDQGGALWSAHWDGFKLIKYSLYGEKREEIKVPVPRPTSCCFGGADNKQLFITSARTGLSDTSMQQYPLSGNVFACTLKSSGQKVPPFRLTPC